ncbi:unnamed protein product, partial [Cladocopium goreaui]
MGAVSTICMWASLRLETINIVFAAVSHLKSAAVFEQRSCHPQSPVMTAAEAKFYRDGYTHRTVLFDGLQSAKAEHGGSLNFSAYRQGRDRQYLGVNGKNYYAKPWGNDSSNIQAVINGPAYWKRVYYRENIAARFAREDAE